MQCVILMAGKGTRLRPLTDERPKPLVLVAGKPIVEHIVSALPDDITELIFIVGYKAEMIKEHCGTEYLGRRVVYREQENHAGGTGDALLCAKDVLKGKFLFLNGDDIYGQEGLQAIVKENHAIFGVHSDTPERFGVLVTNEDGTLKSIIEKPSNPPSNFVNIGAYVANDSIFSYDISLAESGELYVTDFITAYAQDNPVKIIEQDLWLPIGYPDDIPKAESILSQEAS